MLHGNGIRVVLHGNGIRVVLHGNGIRVVLHFIEYYYSNIVASSLSNIKTSGMPKCRRTTQTCGGKLDISNMWLDYTEQGRPFISNGSTRVWHHPTACLMVL